MKKFIITEEERSRILGMHKSATSRQYLMEGFTAPNGITYKLDFKDANSFNQFVGQSSSTVPNPYVKKLGVAPGGVNSFSSFITNIWQSLAFTGRSPLKFAWGNLTMVRNLLSEASAGLSSLYGFPEAKEFLSDEKIKIWSSPVDPKNPSYTIWNWFYDTYIKPDIQTRASLIKTPATATPIKKP